MELAQQGKDQSIPLSHATSRGVVGLEKAEVEDMLTALKAAINFKPTLASLSSDVPPRVTSDPAEDDYIWAAQREKDEAQAAYAAEQVSVSYADAAKRAYEIPPPRCNVVEVEAETVSAEVSVSASAPSAAQRSRRLTHNVLPAAKVVEERATDADGVDNFTKRQSEMYGVDAKVLDDVSKALNENPKDIAQENFLGQRHSDLLLSLDKERGKATVLSHH